MNIQNIKSNFWFLLFVIIFGVLPLSALASAVYFSSSAENIYKDDIFIIKTKISSLENFINAAEGSILFDKNLLEIKEVSTGGSVFSLWPKGPVFSNDEGKISFVGGTPEGFRGEEAEFLKIIFSAKEEGEASLGFGDDFVLFLNDGKGTKIEPQLKSLALSILKRPPELAPKDIWQEFVKEDKIPPEAFEIDIGKDPAIFGNKYFISFFTTDEEAGIDYYEVKEGEREFIRTKSPYLLKDQSLESLLKVKAVDRAGNERIEEFKPTVPEVIPPIPFYKTIIFWIAILVLVVALAIFFRSKIKIQKSK